MFATFLFYAVDTVYLEMDLSQALDEDNWSEWMGTSEGSRNPKPNWGQNFITSDFSNILSKTQDDESSFSLQRAFHEYYICSQESSIQIIIVTRMYFDYW